MMAVSQCTGPVGAAKTTKAFALFDFVIIIYFTGLLTTCCVQWRMQRFATCVIFASRSCLSTKAHTSCNQCMTSIPFNSSSSYFASYYSCPSPFTYFTFLYLGHFKPLDQVIFVKLIQYVKNMGENSLVWKSDFEKGNSKQFF